MPGSPRSRRGLRLAFAGTVVIVALLAAAKLTDELLRLVWRSGRSAAIDLALRHAEVHGWFAGDPVYGALRAPTYPPAAYATLWPLIGWMPFQPARWVWAAATVAALAVMTSIAVRESGASNLWQRAFVALMLLAMNQTGVAVGNGQLILLVLPPLVIGLLLVHCGRGTWAEDLAASVCVIFAMVKVTLAAPFLWLVLFAPASGREPRMWRWRLRPTLLVAAGYAGLTLFAATFQKGGVLLQLREWMRVAQEVSDRGGDYANLNAWLDGVGLARVVPAISLVVFVALGAWLYRYHRVDLWTRLGAVAIVTRFWSYHRLYDDVLVVLALVALFRIAAPLLAGNESASELVPAIEGARGRRVGSIAAALIVTSMFFSLLPARLGAAPTPWHQIFDVTHATTWLGMLAFLGWFAAEADRSRRRLAA